MADTPQVTFEKMKTMHGLIVRHQAGIKKAYEAARKDLRAGIDHQSEEEIKLALPALDAAVGKIDPGLDACERMQTMAAELLKHADFVAAHKDEVKKIVSESAAAKKELTEWAAEARKLKAEADRTAGTAHKGAAETDAELGALKNRARILKEEITACKTGFPKHEKAAREATDKDNGKDAEKARLAMLDLMETPKRHVLELRPLLKHFQDEHKEIDRAQKAELQYVVDDLQDADDTLTSGMATYTKLLKLWQQAAADKAQRPKAPEPVPKAVMVQVAGIAGIDPKDAKAMGLLAKVINDTPKEKWAEGLTKLATQLKLKNTNGKAMVVAIDKLPHFKKQLIDL